MDNLIFSLNATIPIFLVMVAGYVFRQIGLVDDGFVKTLNSFNYKVTLPVLLVVDIAEADFYTVWDTKFVLFCFGVTLVCILTISLLCRLFMKDKSIRGEFIQASYRGSAAVLGVAFMQNIYGTSAIAPLMILATVPLYNVAAVMVLSFTAPNTSGLDKKSFQKSLKGIATNPIIWGILIGMVISVAHIELPFIINKTLHNFSVLATPLALIGLGAGFEGRKALARIKPTIISTLIKLFVMPAVFLPIAASMGFRDEKMVAILIMLGAPTTVSCYIMSRNMGHEGVLSSSCVVSTTFLSSVFITLWLYLLKSFGLIS
ncbi:MAG: AEC family transporter [Lachnospiraceae bacterium]|nr:AEC family transporter [Lachnospiraceae bacterium]